MVDQSSRVIGLGTVLGILVPVMLFSLGVAWYAGTWNGADIARAKEFVDFRTETTKKLDDLNMEVIKTHNDVADIRLVVCLTNPGRCRLKSADEDRLEDTHRAASR